VTGSTQNEWNETKAQRDRVHKLKRDFWHCGVIYNVLFTVAIIFAMVRATTTTFFGCQATSKGDSIAMQFLTRMGWPPILNICYLLITSNWVPIFHALFPPSYPDRQTVMGPHALDSGGRYPTVEVRTSVSSRQKEPLGYCNHLALIPVILWCLLTAVLLA
jgi:hypothetical protein